MRKFTLFLVLLLTASLFAIEQIKLIVHLNDDAPVEYVAIEVDSITFSDVYVEPETPDTLENYENGHEYVDLGLPSGTKWATMNVGADSPEDYGDYFAWGETTSNTGSNYNYSSNPTTLPLDRDAAYTNWGCSWRMPTKAEQDELRNTYYTTWTWTTQNGVKGHKVTSKTNGNSIFLPASGNHNGSGFLYGAGSYGKYWSSSLSTNLSNDAYYLDLLPGDVYSSSYGRQNGLSVRPVLTK